MTGLVLSFLQLILLAVIWNTHEVIDDVEIIVDHVAAGHDILTVEQGRVVDVRRGVGLLKPTTTCCL